MSVRSYLRAEDRKAQILQVAKAVFAAKGYRGANIADICESARIARGTLYQYFDNKEAVLVAVLEQIADRIETILRERPRIGELDGVGQAPLQMVVAFSKKRLAVLLDAVFEDEETLRIIFRESRGLDGAVETILHRIEDTVLGYIEDDVRSAQEAGLLRTDVSPALVARYVLGGVEKMVLTALTRDETIDIQGIIDVACSVQLFGLLKEDRR